MTRAELLAALVTERFALVPPPPRPDAPDTAAVLDERRRALVEHEGHLRVIA